jgi:hypothetical protein
MTHAHRLWVMCAAASCVTLAPALSNAQSTLTTRHFYQGDNPAPFSSFHTDWAPGLYKAQCSSGGPVMGLSINLGYARAVGCVTPSPFGYPLPFPDTSGSSANTQTFFASDSPGYTAHTHVAYDWDPGYHKGECPGASIVIGLAQNPQPLELGKILCSSHNYDLTGSPCSVRTYSSNAGAPLGSGWEAGYAKFQCDVGQVMVGVSSHPTVHLPHRILCCGMGPVPSF